MLAKKFRFIKPSRTMREVQVMDLVEKNPQISQRILARDVFISSTMVNNYLADMVSRGMLKIQGNTNRSITYFLTPQGKEHKDKLLRSAMSEIVQFYGIIKDEFRKKLESYYDDGVRTAVLFGAAETGELMYMTSTLTPLKIVAFVDNDKSKWGRKIGGLEVLAPEKIAALKPDAVIVSSFGYADEIIGQLEGMNLNGTKILIP